MVERRFGSMLVALALAAGSACAARGPGVMNGGPRDVGTPILLLPPEENSSGCTVRFKEGSVTSYANRLLRLRVINYCNAGQTVMVGNFRLEETASPAPENCRNAMHAGAAPIFQQDDERRRTATPAGVNSAGQPSHADIRLLIKRSDDLPKGKDEKRLEYYFDVCLNGPIAEDPRLIIER